MRIRMVFSRPALVALLITATAWPCLAAESVATSPAASGAVARQPMAGGPSWTSLSLQQRTALAPLAADWGAIEPSSKSKWLEVATRFPAMPAGEQQRVQQRMAEWARMTPAERGRARLSFQESKQFTPEQKQARWEAYQALPADQRRALADRARPSSAAAKPPDGASAPKSGAEARPGAASRPMAAGALVKQVAPTLVQAKPGATTRLMTAPAAPPAHQQPGQPKIAAKPGQVDRSTLLPRSGPQATAAASRPAAP